MSKRMLALLLCVILTLSCFTGCAREQKEETTPTAAVPQTVSITEQITVDGKKLTMDVQVEVPDLSSLHEVTLTFDEELLDKVVKELVHSQYPGLEDGTMDGYRTWSVATDKQLLFSLDCEDSGFRAGWAGYLDVLRDLNGQDMGEDEHMRWTPYYLTDHIPDKLNMTSTEAAENISTFLEQYSCFQYIPWNVVAVNCRNVPDSSGYYQAMMRPEYEGMAVFIDEVPHVSTCISAEGVFTFQGMMVLKEQSREPIEVTMPLEDAVAQFKEDFADDPKGNQVKLERIYVGYISESYFDETRSLSPAWIFEYSAVKPHFNTGEDMTQYYTNVYRMKDGTPFYYNY